MSQPSNSPSNPGRRTFLRNGGLATIFAAGVAPYLRFAPAAMANAGPATPFRYTPFTRALPLPSRMAPRTLTPAPGSATAAVGSPAVYHGIAPEYQPGHAFNKQSWVLNDPATGAPFKEVHHELAIRTGTHEFIPGVKTPIFGYNGIFPGQTMRARLGEPMVVRVRNTIADVESSLHLHGGHTPSHADGHPCFYTFPGQARDYFYPHIAPRHDGTSQMDTNEAPSTMWYHDHGNDVTAYNVTHGLVGFSLLTDALEEKLIRQAVLPDVDHREPPVWNATKKEWTLGALKRDAAGATIQGPYDIPLALTDQRFNADGTLWWDMFDHDGRLGDVYTINGVAQPVMKVEPRKYRFRFCGSSPARVYMLRLSNGQAMTQIGNDSWLLPKALSTTQVYLNPAKRADIIIDFSKLAGKTVYLENIMQQSSGRKPDGVDASRPERMMKIDVTLPLNKAYPECSVAPGTALRPHTTLVESQATVTRYFDFNRSNGAWQVNGEFYSAYRCDAAIRKGALEKWVLRNGSGGWWHPIHIHVEAHQILRINGKAPTEAWRYKSDNSSLEDNMTVEMLMKFRTFTGPFVFHCHNNNHEDMRMMKQIEVCDVVNGVQQPPMLNGKWFSVPAAVSGVPQDYVLSHPGLFS